jgi:hypothetical protein
MDPNINENKVDWNNIFILDELLTHIEPCQIKDFSLLSQFIRNKLKPKFSLKIELSKKHIIKKYNLNTLTDSQKAEISDYYYYWDNRHLYEKFKDNWEKRSSNNSGVLILKQLIEEEIKGIKCYLRNCTVDRLSDSFYFLCPLVLDLNNLTKLSLYDCTFPLLTMLRIGEHFKNLKTLDLCSVKFVGLIKQELSPEDVYLPDNLEELSFTSCKIYRVHSASNIPILLQNCTDHHRDNINLTQAIRIPTLKKLNYDLGCYSGILKKLMKSNLQLEELYIYFYDFTQEVYELMAVRSLLSLTVYLDLDFPYFFFDKNLIIPKFNYIRNLKLQYDYIGESVLGHSQCFTKYFPNLTHLILNIEEYDLEDFQLNGFLKVNLLFNNTIYKLTLELTEDDSARNEYGYTPYEPVLDFSNLVNINSLIIDMDLIPLYSIDFENIPDKLKFIRYFISCKSNTVKYIEENPRIFRKWNVEFKDKYVYFTR